MEMTRRSVLASSVALMVLPRAAQAQAQTSNAPDMVAGIPVNYDESKVGSYVLPKPLVAQDGTPIRTVQAWFAKRRPEIVRLFETQQFGIAPGRPVGLTFAVRERDAPAFGGKARRKQVRIQLSPDPAGPAINLALYTPAAISKPVPVLLAINFGSNAATINDPGLDPGLVWNAEQHRRIAYKPGGRVFGHIDPLPLIEAGLGFAAFYYGDVDPDDPMGFASGIRARYLKNGQTRPGSDEWGAIAAWGWGISRAIDYLETDHQVDARRVAIHGVSRLGKTVMWAGAHDTRVAATIASCSGEGGAALSRRNYGETIAHLVAPSRYPYQFAANYARWAGFPDVAPMDANLLVALHAPRPLLLQTGNVDNWSDPKGEFLSAVDAGQVYRLLRKQDLGTQTWPNAGQPVLRDLSYLMHEGGHGTVPSDWPVYLDFLKMHLKPEA